MNHLISNPVETSAALSLSHDWHGRLRARQCSIVRPPHLGHCLQLCVKLDTSFSIEVHVPSEGPPGSSEGKHW